MTEKESLIELDESTRRSFMKKGAIATGGLALGVGGASTAAAQDGGQSQGTALMFATEFIPGATFQNVGQLPNSLTMNLLRAGQGGNVPNVNDYNGYIVNYTFTDVPKYTFLFSTADLQSGQSYMMSPEASYFTGNLNMIESQLQQAGGGGGGGGGTTTTTTEGTTTTTTTTTESN